MISQRQLFKSSIVVGAACLGLGSFSPPASAITIFNFGDSDIYTPAPNGSNLSYSLAAGSEGITMTISNYRLGAGGTASAFSIDADSNGDGFGIELFDVAPSGDRFDIAFNQAVFINAYFVVDTTGTNQTLDFTQTGSLDVSTGNPFTIFDFPTGRALNVGNGSGSPATAPFLVPAGSTVTVRATFPALGKAQTGLSGLEVQAVPWETDVLPLVGATILFGGGMWWKRRRQASQIALAPTPDHGDSPTPQ